MKKTALLLIVTLLFSLVSLGASANVGSVIGQACHTDITARINGYDIASYNVNGNTYIIAEDLADYGFAVVWNSQKRTILIDRDKSVFKIYPTYTKPSVAPYLVGKSAHKILSTDIRAYTVGQSVESYNINGATIIPFDCLAIFGEVIWDANARKIELTLPDVAVGTPLPANVGKESILNVGDKALYVGMSASSLGTPEEILSSTCGITWYVYGTKTYKDFFAAGVSDGKVIVLASAGVGFNYNGYKAGDTISNYNTFTQNLYFDKNDNNTVHAVMLGNPEYIDTITEDMTMGESKMVFHFTNAFRVYHGKKAFEWCTKAHTSALLHSRDMADNNYFDHTSLDGRKMSKRMSDQGIRWSSCAENIAAGNRLGFDTYDQWINSSGHRKNILGDYHYLGVGCAYNSGSRYKLYYTQNFYR